MNTVPSSAELYEAGLVAGVTFVAEFSNMGVRCMAIPSDFYVRKPPGSRVVKCVWTGRETTMDELALRLDKRRCVLVFMPCAMRVSTTPIWLPTTAKLMSP